ncbi:MAG: hypothetical protein AAF724_01845 [Pseudomonadota bacterium]
MDETETHLEKEFGLLFHHYVCLIQKHAESRNPIHLCFAPIGTNMLMLASEISINVKMRRRTVVEEGAYRFDEHQIEQFNLEHGTDHSVRPWVMQRFGDHFSNPNPWTIWFEDICKNETECVDFSSQAARLEEKLAAIRPRIAAPHRIELGVCVDYVSRLNAAAKKRVESQLAVAEEGFVSVHIRRGDASNEATDEADPDRQHFSHEQYIEEMERYLTRGYSGFYLLTESQLEIDRISEHFKGRCRVVAQPIDRKQFPNLIGKKHGKANFIEYLYLDNPDLIEFSMHSALVDLENAGRCQAFIGSFESAFSNLAYLKAVGHHHRNIEHTDLAGDKFGVTLFYPNLDERRGTSLFVIKERDVGFFSMFLQVVNTLFHIENAEEHAIPHVNLTDKQEYFTGSETWEDFFEPLAFLNPAALEPYLERVNRSFEERLPEMKLWDQYGVTYKIADNLSWSGSYYPRLKINKILGHLPLKTTFKSHRFMEKAYKRLTGQAVDPASLDAPKNAAKYHISHIVLPDKTQRQSASVVIGRYINLKAEVKNQVEALFEPFENHYIVGVQFRGTDARKDERRMVPAYDLYIDEIKRHLESRDPNDHRETLIFVASDEDDFITFLSGYFDNVIHFDALRHAGDKEDEKSGGKLGWGMPAFIREDRKKALEGAVLDYAGLCRANYMIHNFGSLTNSVLLTNPEMGNCLIGDDYRKS